MEDNPIKDKKTFEIIKENRITELTGKIKEECVEANDYFMEIGQPKKIEVEEVILNSFQKITLEKAISHYGLTLQVMIDLNFHELMSSNEININELLKVSLKHKNLEFETIDSELLDFNLEVKNFEDNLEFNHKNNLILFKDESKAKIILFNYISELFDSFFGVYYKLKVDKDKVLLEKSKN